jgi:hypothetical protein
MRDDSILARRLDRVECKKGGSTFINFADIYCTFFQAHSVSFLTVSVCDLAGTQSGWAASLCSLMSGHRLTAEVRTEAKRSGRPRAREVAISSFADVAMNLPATKKSDFASRPTPTPTTIATKKREPISPIPSEVTHRAGSTEIMYNSRRIPPVMC